MLSLLEIRLQVPLMIKVINVGIKNIMVTITNMKVCNLIDKSAGSGKIIEYPKLSENSFMHVFLLQKKKMTNNTYTYALW